jgi:hypothetical protein
LKKVINIVERGCDIRGGGIWPNKNRPGWTDKIATCKPERSTSVSNAVYTASGGAALS